MGSDQPKGQENTFSEPSIPLDDDNKEALLNQLKNSVVMCDPITRLIVQYAIYILIFGLAFVSTTLPLSLTNIILLGFMTIIVVRCFLFSSQVQLYKNSHTLLWLLNVLTLIAIITRYIAQF